MSITSKPRKRLSPEDSRAAALEAARDLLLEAGPQAVTLKAVAGRIGRTHANLLHHFGSADRFLAASQEELEAVPGLPAKTARSVYGQLHRTGGPTS